MPPVPPGSDVHASTWFLSNFEGLEREWATYADFFYFSVLCIYAGTPKHGGEGGSAFNVLEEGRQGGSSALIMPSTD